MNINFPSMQPEILEELSYIYNELRDLKNYNKNIIEENNELKMKINDQNRKLDIVHRLFNTYSKIVSENSRKIEKVSDKKTKQLDLLQKIKNLENELYITKLSKSNSTDIGNIFNNLVNQ